MLGAELIPIAFTAYLLKFLMLADLTAFAGLAVRPAATMLADGRSPTLLAAILEVVVHAKRAAFAIPTLVLASTVWAFP